MLARSMHRIDTTLSVVTTTDIIHAQLDSRCATLHYPLSIAATKSPHIALEVAAYRLKCAG